MRVRKLFWWSLVLLTALALADGYLGSPTAGWGWERFITWGQPQLRPEGPSAETTGVVEAPMAPGEVLSVSNIRGNLQVTGGAADRLQTRYTITVFAEDEAAAAQYAEALEVVAVRREEGLVLELIRPAETPPGVQSVAVDYQIAVPRGARIQVENRLGQVEVAGVAGPSWVENGYGETVLRNLQGDWSVRTRFSTFQVDEVRGALVLSGTYSTGRVRNVAGPVTGDVTGSLTVDGAAAVDLDASYTELKLARIEGPIDLDLAFGQATIEGLRHDLRAKGSYGDVTVVLDASAPGFQIAVESRGGDVRNGAALLRGERVVNDRGTSWLEALVGDGAHRVQISLRNGHVTLK
ncbi:MAG: hypothetical protein GX961_09315 [Firmicutes bacterium]|nr:hypothetical protein [Bacillota bacterium]